MADFIKVVVSTTSPRNPCEWHHHCIHPMAPPISYRRSHGLNTAPAAPACLACLRQAGALESQNSKTPSVCVFFFFGPTIESHDIHRGCTMHSWDWNVAAEKYNYHYADVWIVGSTPGFKVEYFTHDTSGPVASKDSPFRFQVPIKRQKSLNNCSRAAF